MDWKKLTQNAKELSSKAVSGLAVITNDVSTSIAGTDWFKGLNDYTSELSKSMDAEFLKQGISKVMQPINHRIMDGGHDFFTTIEKAQELGDKNGWDSIETFQQWASSYFTDLSSSAGMPMFGKFSDEIYSFLRSMNLDEATARDFVTMNGQEVLEAAMGGAVTSLAIIFAWKKEDKEAFSKTVAAILCTGAVTLNPASLVIAILALGLGYNKLVCKESMARGAISSVVGLSVSAIVPGPVLLGLVPALVASVYVSKKMGKDFNPIEYSAKIIELIRSEEFKKTTFEIYQELSGKVKKAA